MTASFKAARNLCDNRAIVQAASQASKTADFILGLMPQPLAAVDEELEAA
jgi:antirestriction protein ArdC